MKILLNARCLSALCLLSASFLLAGCDSSKKGDDKPADSGSAGEGEVSNIKGEIKINGSSTVQPISNAIRELFAKEYPDVKVDVGGDGTGTGFKDFYGKSTHISDASRPIKPGELEECKKAGVEFVELPVAYDGLTIVVHPDNDWVKELTVDHLKQIFTGESGKKWKDVDPAWPDEVIKIYAPGTGSGTYDYFKEVVAKKDGLEFRKDMSLNENDNTLVKGVAGDANSIGFFGVAYYEKNKDSLRAVPIINPDDKTAYLPTPENIAQNKYSPFSRPLFIYVNTKSLEQTQVQAFVTFYLEQVSEICEKVGYVRLPEEILAMSQKNFDAVAAGTHFVKDGESREGLFVDLFKAENLSQ